jgi:hypothetical protein
MIIRRDFGLKRDDMPKNPLMQEGSDLRSLVLSFQDVITSSGLTTILASPVKKQNIMHHAYLLFRRVLTLRELSIVSRNAINSYLMHYNEYAEGKSDGVIAVWEMVSILHKIERELK